MNHELSTNKDRASILIVDDEDFNIDVLVGLLKHDYRLLIAMNATQALERLDKSLLPDLILLDIVMPGLDGYEVCRRIKSNPKTSNIPVIFITGKIDEEDEAKGFQVGAVDYITKPFSPLVVLARVKTHVELKRRGDMLERLAGLDGLTGIGNRRKFDEFLANEWKRCLRRSNPISLVMGDIDFFKRYNDYYGHAKGDEVLKGIAQVITQSTRQSEDLAARYGGEEFVCVLPQTDLSGAHSVAERIKKGVDHLSIPHADSDAANHITLSMGLASVVPNEDSSATGLIELADNALYEAKRTGRNRISLNNNP